MVTSAEYFTDLTFEPLVDSLPVIDDEVQFDKNGLILQDTLLFDWEEFSVSDALYIDSGEMTIYREKIYTGTSTDDYVYWNLFESISNDTSAPVLDNMVTTVTGDVTTFDVTMDSTEGSALEAKYSQTDYSISDVYDALNDPENYSITGSIGTALSSAISEALTTSRLSTKFIWNKSHQKPFKKPNETAIGIPTDDE